MKRMLIAALIAVTATLAHAGPIRGLIDIATGIEVPDADARYALAGSGLTTNDSPTMVSGTTWAFDSATVNTTASNGLQVVNYQSMTNWVSGSFATNIPNVAYTDRYNVFTTSNRFGRVFTTYTATTGFEVVNYATMAAQNYIKQGTTYTVEPTLGYLSISGNPVVAWSLQSLYGVGAGVPRLALNWYSKVLHTNDVYAGTHIWQSQGTATNGFEIVNYQTMTNVIVTLGPGLIPVFSGQDTTGLVTSAAADVGKYLKADGTWDTPVDTDTTFTNWVAVSGGLLSLTGANRSGSNTVSLTEADLTGAGFVTNGAVFYGTISNSTVVGLLDGGTYSNATFTSGVVTNSDGWFNELYVSNGADAGLEVVNYQTMTNWYFSEASLTNETTLAMTNIVSFPNGIYVAGQLIDGTVSDISIANVLFDANFVPESANTYDIGSSLYPLNEVYSTYGFIGDGSVVDSALLSVSDSQAILAGLANTSSSASNAGGFLGLYSDDGALMANDNRLGGVVIGGSINVPTLYNGIGIIGYADGAWGVNDYPTRLEFSVTPDGTSSRQLGLTIYNDSTLEIYGNIIPDASNAYSIGSAQLPLAEIHATDGYFASGTVYIGDVPIRSDGTNIIANVVTTNNETYATVDWVDLNRARVNTGIFSQPIAAVTNETLYISNGLITMYDNASRTGNLHEVAMASTNLSIAYNTYRWLAADWNNGSPVYTLLDSPATINNADIISVGQIYNVSNGTTHAHVFISGTDAKSTANRISNRLISTATYEYNSGLAITEVGDPSLVITMDSGYVWYDATVLSIAAVDISDTNLYAYVTDGAGDWGYTKTDEVNDSLYDTGTGTAAIGNHEYGVNWIYAFASGDDELVQVLGNASYGSIAAARAAQPRSDLPPFIRRMCFLVAQVIVWEDDPGDIQEINSPWTRTFFSQQTTVHNNLSGLNDGDYQHLTAAEKSTFDLITTINDGSSFYSVWTAGTNSLYIVSPNGQYTNLLMTTTP